MARGKAEPIRLTKLERRALENFLPKLEDFSDERAQYLNRTRDHTIKPRLYGDRHYMPIIKMKAILMAADGKNNREIARTLEVSEHAVGIWRNDFIYILSRTDLAFERIKGFFLYDEQYWNYFNE